ncbi:unnamed protein product, partial [Choristocarpus tenellus]
MLDGTVVQESHSKGDAVIGISWKCVGLHSKGNPSLVVTCVHQVVVYKAGESRRTHQWAFKPSPSTALSHAAMFHPFSSRYVAVQRKTSLISWREVDRDVKQLISAKAPGVVQAIHPCALLGDALVVVAETGIVSLFTGTLSESGRATTAASNGAEGTAFKVVWSGVQGKTVALLEEKEGGGGERMSLFSVCPAPSSSNSTKRSEGAPAVLLSASYPLEKPPSHITRDNLGSGVGTQGRGGDADSLARVCSAELHGMEEDATQKTPVDLTISVAWRTCIGSVWTKINLCNTAGPRLEFARQIGPSLAPLSLPPPPPVASADAAGGTLSTKKAKLSKNAKLRCIKEKQGGDSKPEGQLVSSFNTCDSTPLLLATGVRSQLIVYSGSNSNNSNGNRVPALLSMWDTKYGVLLEANEAPLGDWNLRNNGVEGRTLWECMEVSGDGEYLALAETKGVIVCPLPARAGAGTLASILRHGQRRGVGAVGVKESACRSNMEATDWRGMPSVFPTIDFNHNADAKSLLQHPQPLGSGEWDPVVRKFQNVEAKIVESLSAAAAVGDWKAFDQALEEHRLHGMGLDGGQGSSGDPEAGAGTEMVVGRTNGVRRKRGRGGKGVHGRVGYSSVVVSKVVELCMLYPEAELWSSLEKLVRSGGVSARHHQGMVGVLLKHAPSSLLEEVLANVKDLPEADAVRILRHFLLHAAALAANTTTSEPCPGSGWIEEGRSGTAGEGSEGRLLKRARHARCPDNMTPSKGVVETKSSRKEKDGSPAVGKGGGSKKGVSTLPGGEGGKKGLGAGGKKRKAGKRSSEEMSGECGEGGGGEVVENGPSHVHLNGSSSMMNGHAGEGEGYGSDSSLPCKGKEGVMEGKGRSKQSSGKRRPCQVLQLGMGEVAPDDVTLRNKGRGRKGVVAVKDRSRAKARAAAAAAERAVQATLLVLPNEAFLRSALAKLGRGEALVVLKVLKDMLVNGGTSETGQRGPQSDQRARGSAASSGANGPLPRPPTSVVLGWAAAILDAQFAALAVGGRGGEGTRSL